MTRVQATSVGGHERKTTKHPGVYSKCKSSKNKNSKYYVKPYRGQGR